jgi:hypothetical protein
MESFLQVNAPFRLETTDEQVAMAAGEKGCFWLCRYHGRKPKGNDTLWKTDQIEWRMKII